MSDASLALEIHVTDGAARTGILHAGRHPHALLQAVKARVKRAPKTQCWPDRVHLRIGDQICELIRCGEDLLTIEKRKGFPPASTTYGWLARSGTGTGGSSAFAPMALHTLDLAHGSAMRHLIHFRNGTVNNCVLFQWWGDR